jgi:hypothetical protein
LFVCLQRRRWRARACSTLLRRRHGSRYDSCAGTRTHAHTHTPRTRQDVQQHSHALWAQPFKAAWSFPSARAHTHARMCTKQARINNRAAHHASRHASTHRPNAARPAAVRHRDARRDAGQRRRPLAAPRCAPAPPRLDHRRRGRVTARLLRPAVGWSASARGDGMRHGRRGRCRCAGLRKQKVADARPAPFFDAATVVADTTRRR